MSRFLPNLLSRVLAPAPAIQPRLASRYEPAAGPSRTAAAPFFGEEHVESHASPSPAVGPSLATPPTMSAHLRTAAPDPAPFAPRPPVPVSQSTADFAIPDFLPRSPVPSPALRPALPARSRPPEDLLPPEGDRSPPPLLAPTSSRSHLSRVEDTARPGDSAPAFPSLFFPRRDSRPSRAPLVPAVPASEPPSPVPATASPAPALSPASPPLVPSPLPPPSAPPAASSGAPLEPPSIPAPEPSIRVTIGRVEIRAMPPPPPPSRPAASAPARRPALPLEEYLRRRDAA